MPRVHPACRCCDGPADRKPWVPTTGVIASLSPITSPVAIGYHLGDLETLLAGVKRPGDYFAHGSMELLAPELEVEGVGL